VKNPRNKGKVGEREFARFLRAYGFEARRGVQYQGGENSPDVCCAALPFHVEVKRVERLNLRDAVAQAEGDAAGKPWLVAHRWNLGPWLVTLRAEELLALAREAQTSSPPNPQPSNNLAPSPAPCGVDKAAEPKPQRTETNRTAPKGT